MSEPKETPQTLDAFFNENRCEYSDDVHYNGYILIAHHEKEQVGTRRALSLKGAMLDVAQTRGNNHHVIASFLLESLTCATLLAYLNALPSLLLFPKR